MPGVESPNSSDTLETNSVTYFSGYVAKKCMKILKCNQCKTDMIKSNQNLEFTDELLLFYKAYLNDFLVLDRGEYIRGWSY